MTNAILYTQAKCIPCKYLEEFLKKNNLNIKIEPDGYHPLASNRPTLVIGGTSAVVGVIAIEKYLKTNFLDKHNE